ncbi:MAG: hypothetical protein E7292_06695 [Lachnospiraceae bacterium]|nr:hypothetical protein [Lachnospiraceae bacterium]
MAWESTGEVRMPEEVDGRPVREIARKEFLSKKNLRKITVPACVTEVGDWAFAYCDNLHTAVFEGRPVFGRAVFLECKGLRFLYVGTTPENAESDAQAVAALLAAAVTVADAPYLLDAKEAGSAEWLQKWDARMQVILESPDTEGYSKQVLCGEEDYGSTDLTAYISNRRKWKVRLAFLRLLYPLGLGQSMRQLLESYLREHTKGCESEETWQVVLVEHGDERLYYQLFADLGCITEENFDGLLTDVREDKPELRAYLMRYKSEHFGISDFFGGLDL